MHKYRSFGEIQKIRSTLHRYRFTILWYCMQSVACTAIQLEACHDVFTLDRHDQREQNRERELAKELD
jgi:hypothetical protein